MSTLVGTCEHTHTQTHTHTHTHTHTQHNTGFLLACTNTE